MKPLPFLTPTHTHHISTGTAHPEPSSMEGGEAPQTVVNPQLLHLLVGDSTASADGVLPTCKALGQVGLMTDRAVSLREPSI